MTIDAVIMAFAFGFTGLVVYLLLRYGHVTHSYLTLDKEQVNALKEMNRAYRASHPPSKPFGRPLYKKKMVSHSGLAVYQNGLYAKFVIGKQGKYRFVPFDEISGIYPMKIENPLTKTDTRLYGLASWKVLQVETASSMVLVIDSQKHDLEQLVPILKNAMGAGWGRAYRPDEQLWSNILTGDYLIHRSVRKTEAPGPKPSMSFAMPPPISAPKEKGRLLLEESQEEVRQRSGTFVRGAMVLGSAALAFVALGMYFASGMRVGGVSLSFTGYFMVTMGILLVVVVAVILAMARSLRPLKIYENGFEATSPLGNRKFFFSFGELVDVRETRNFIDGEVYLFKSSVPNQGVAIRKNMHGFSDIYETIRRKIGKEEYVVKLEPSKEEAVTSRKIEYTLYAISAVAGAVAGVVLAIIALSGQSFVLFVTGVGLIVPQFTMLAVTYMTFRMRKMGKTVPARLNIKVPAGIVVAMLVYFLLNLAVSSSLPGSQPPPHQIEAMPTSSSITQGIYEDSNLTANGYVLINSGQTLQLRNSTLTMNLTADRRFGVWVADGGTLFLENTTVASAVAEYRYTFEIMGIARIIDTEISGLWGDPLYENYDGGLEIYSSHVVLDGVRIVGSRTNGILVRDSSPTIVNSTIMNSKDDGIEIHNSRATITNSTVTGCAWAMIVSEDSSVTIRGNLIYRNKNGIAIQHSDPVIQDNRFDSNSGYAIRYDEYSSPIISRNTYVGNDEDVVAVEPSYLLEICGVSTIALTVVCLVVLFWVYKEGLRKESEPQGRFGRLYRT